ncbi:MAG TPA: transglycosylase family protein [Solirubrobacteraceae bacterium]|jgi:septal ring factor EnvC (AmiA/AmiB activator)|nr:transglycosylase family protein [Solirubrobacteraceae bacterium]
MKVPERRNRRRIVAAALAASACVIPALTGSATGDNLTQLQNKLGSAQSQLNSTKQHQQSLASSIAALNSQVSSLASQISLVQSREASARERLTTYESKLADTRVAIAHEHARLAHLHNVLDRSVSALKSELVSQYEQPQQSVVSLVVNSSGFQQLLDGLQYLSRAKHQEQSIITVTRTARDEAQAATDRLSALQRSDATAANDASTQTNALAGMGALLNSRETALGDARAAQDAALTASKEQGAKLQAAIATIQQQQTAAEQAVRNVTYSAETSPSGGTSLSSSAGWTIPYAIVLCESGGQNLPPNSAGASGYYQIMPATWSEFGGSGSAAYMAPKSEQDAVAAKIWNNGAGASNWTCAGIVGIT